MSAIVNVLSSVEFWKLAVPLLGAALSAAGAWLFNERRKRLGDEYQRKEASYKELIRCLSGFYVETQDTEIKKKFLDQVNLCWLYCPDQIIKKAYDFLDTVHTGTATAHGEKERVLGELVCAIRADLLSRKVVKRTSLSPRDFRLLRAT